MLTETLTLITLKKIAMYGGDLWKPVLFPCGASNTLAPDRETPEFCTN